MAVVPISKVRILSYRSDVAKMLDIVQRAGAIEFKEVAEIKDFSVEAVVLGKNYQDLISKIKHNIDILGHYEVKMGTLAKLKQGTTINLSESQLAEQLVDNSELEAIFEEIRAGHDEEVNLKEQIRVAGERKKQLLPWQSLTIPMQSLLTKSTNTYLLRVKKIKSKGIDPKKPMAKKIEAVLDDAGFLSYVEEVNRSLFSVTVYRTPNASLLPEIIKLLRAESVLLPVGEGTIASNLATLEKKAVELEKSYQEAQLKMAELAQKYLRKLKIAHDVWVWNHDKNAAAEFGKSSKYLTIFEGWCNQQILPQLEADLTKAGVIFNISDIPLLAKESSPVEIKNNPLVEPFEVVTRLGGLPGPRDIDPTPFMAFFFLFFAAMSLTDSGYGLLLMAFTFPVAFYFAVSKQVKLFARLLFMVGAATVVMGLFFGGYFGISMSQMPQFLQDLQVFNPVNDPLKVFGFALILGIIQVMFGMTLGILREAKNGQVMQGVLDKGPWLLLFITLILYGMSSIGFIAGSVDFYLNFVYAAVAIIMLTSARKGVGIFDKIKKGVLSLYGSVSYFSDILSYSRLLALGLATSALAFAVNLIAGIVNDLIPVIGFIAAGLVLVFGHMLTLAINTLGAFIHSARLQFIEFFGKFVVESGRLFKPLTRKESYVNFKKDSG